jgi:16S rRNA (guanine527-N7)-methyltransferase
MVGKGVDGTDQTRYGQTVIEVFLHACSKMDIKICQEGLSLIRRYVEFLNEYRGRRVVGHVSAEEIAVKLLADSFSLSYLPMRLQGVGIDLGSGNGWPGLALKVLNPDNSVVFLDSRKGSCQFIEGFLREAGLEEERVLCQRAELASRSLDHRETYDIATSRAMAWPGTVVELASGFVRVGGVLILWLGPEQESVVEKNPTIPEIGLKLENLIRYELPEAMGFRLLAVYRKTASLGERYPRSIVGIRRTPVM